MRKLLFTFTCFIIVAITTWSALTIPVFATPSDAVQPSLDGTVGILSGSGGNHPDDNSVGISDNEQVRDSQGIVSQLSTTTHNPYNGQIRLDIDIGSEFAEFDGSDITEGIRIKVSPGGIVELPALRARDGYYFVGWGQGGVPEEPTWDPFTTEVEMDTDTSNGKNTSIFALYADEEGNGYCTCGAYESGVYADNLEQIKEINEEYNETLGYQKSLNESLILFLCLLAGTLSIAGLAVLGCEDRSDEKRRNEELESF